MTVLSIIQQAALEIGLTEPAMVIGATNSDAKQLLQHFQAEGKNLRTDYYWPGLIRFNQFQILGAGIYTGSIVSGSTSLLASDVTDVVVGMIVSMNGLLPQTRVVSISGLTVIIDKAATNTEVDAELSFAQDHYVLPADYQTVNTGTEWDQYNRWNLVGSITGIEYTWRTLGYINSGPRRRYRIFGMKNGQFYVNPAPPSQDNGQVLSFEYISQNWIRPQLWQTGLSITAGNYIFWDGNYYQATSTGTTGANPPTNISGTFNDGGVTWQYYSGLYETVLADTDEPNLPDDLLRLGTVWRFLRAKRLDYQDIQQEYTLLKSRYSSSLAGSPDIVLNRPSLLVNAGRLMNLSNVPDSGVGV